MFSLFVKFKRKILDDLFSDLILELLFVYKKKCGSVSGRLTQIEAQIEVPLAPEASWGLVAGG